MLKVFAGMAAAVVLMTACTPTQQGMGIGSVLGGGAGAIIGNQFHGQSGEGALIGAWLLAAIVGRRCRLQRCRATARNRASAPACVC